MRINGGKKLTLTHMKRMTKRVQTKATECQVEMSNFLVALSVNGYNEGKCQREYIRLTDCLSSQVNKYVVALSISGLLTLNIVAISIQAPIYAQL